VGRGYSKALGDLGSKIASFCSFIESGVKAREDPQTSTIVLFNIVQQSVIGGCVALKGI